MTKHKLQLAIYLSALLLSLAVFLPLTSFPVYGEVSYYRIAQMEARLVIVFALCAPAFILAGKGKWSILSPAAVLLVLLYPTLQSYTQSTNQSVLNQIGNDVTAAMVDFSADLFLNITEYHWGGFVFLFALLAFTLAGILFRLKA